MWDHRAGFRFLHTETEYYKEGGILDQLMMGDEVNEYWRRFRDIKTSGSGQGIQKRRRWRIEGQRIEI